MMTKSPNIMEQLNMQLSRKKIASLIFGVVILIKNVSMEDLAIIIITLDEEEENQSQNSSVHPAFFVIYFAFIISKYKLKLINII